MRQTILILTFFMFSFTFASEEKEKPTSTSKPVSNYVVGILKAGPTVVQDSLKKAEMLESHVEFLKKLNREGKLYASGALSSDPAARGLYIFNVSSIREAKELMSEDESVSSGWVSLDYHIWKTRDYTAPVSAEEAETVKEEEDSMWTANAILVGVFTLVIIILMLRTFRMKASV